MWHFSWIIFLDHLSLGWDFLIEKRPASVHMLYTFCMFNFFRTTACPATKLIINVPQWVLKKCYIFLKQLEIQDGCPDLWLAETFSTSSPDLLHVIQQTWQKFSSEVLKKCCGFSERFEIQDGHPGLWLAETFFSYFFQNYFIWSHQTYHKCSFRGCEEMLLSLDKWFLTLLTSNLVFNNWFTLFYILIYRVNVTCRNWVHFLHRKRTNLNSWFCH